MVLLTYQNIKIYLQKVTLQISLKKFLWLKKSKLLCPGHMSLMVLRKKFFLEIFTKKNCKKQIKNNLELKKWSREKPINYILNEKDTIIRLIAG